MLPWIVRVSLDWWLVSVRRSGLVLVSVIAGLSLVVAGCTIDNAASKETEQVQSQTAQDESAQSQAPVATVEDGDTDVDPSVPVEVKSLGEGLKDVVMTNEEGYEVESELSADKMTWTTAETLGYYRTYSIVATDENGEETTIEFQTVAPDYTASAWFNVMDGSTVGVGQTVGVRFDSAVGDRQAAQDAITIKTTPEVDGAFYWISDYEVRWRPQYPWESGTEVEVEADLYGTDLGNGMYGADDISTSFTIGDRMISIVDDQTKTMKVYRNQELLREIPVSLGRDVERWATPNGRYIVGDMHESLIMDSETFGYAHEDGGYRTKVNYATQLSYSGIYVHGAPWSVWAQGNTNTSHGCINMTDADAQWFMSISQRGDIVRVKNTVGGTLPVYDGLGDWNMSWEEWSAGNVDG